jgi:virginiamycin B lyase
MRLSVMVAGIASALLPGYSAAASAGENMPEVTIQATLAHSGDFLGYGFDALWMMSGTKLLRINPADDSVAAIPIDGAVGSYRGIAIGEDAVWVPDVGSKTIFKVDPRQNRVAMKISAVMGQSEGSIGVGYGSVWVVTGLVSTEQKLTRYDAATGGQQAAIALPSGSSGVICDFGSVWVSGTLGDEIYRVDPRTNAIVATVQVHPSPRFLTSGEGSVWVVNQGDGTVQRIDGKSGKVVATIDAKAGGSGGDIAVGGGFVWVTTHLVPVIKIDPRTNTVEKFKRPPGVYLGDAIRYAASSLWISGPSIFRINPPE